MDAYVDGCHATANEEEAKKKGTDLRASTAKFLALTPVRCPPQAPNRRRFYQQTLASREREASWSHIVSHIFSSRLGPTRAAPAHSGARRKP